MKQKQHSERVPKAMQDKFAKMVAITDAFCEEHLDEDYAQLIRGALAAMCRKRPSPVASGAAKSWACGATHAIGYVNFLDDATQTPHMKAGVLYKTFGVSQSTGQAKSKAVRDGLNIGQMDPAWTTSKMLAHNPMVWMLSVNGLLVDVRHMPRRVQVEAYERGLIPYLPEDGEPDGTGL